MQRITLIRHLNVTGRIFQKHLFFQPSKKKLQKIILMYYFSHLFTFSMLFCKYCVYATLNPAEHSRVMGLAESEGFQIHLLQSASATHELHTSLPFPYFIFASS